MIAPTVRPTDVSALRRGRLRLIDDIRHRDVRQTRGDDQRHRAADDDVGAGGGILADDRSARDRHARRGRNRTDRQADGRQRARRGRLRLIDDVGHRDVRQTRGDDQRDRAADDDIRTGRGILADDQSARDRHARGRRDRADRQADARQRARRGRLRLIDDVGHRDVRQTRGDDEGDRAADDDIRAGRGILADDQHDAHVVRGRPQPGDQPVHGGSLVRPVVENGERQIERVSLLPDREHLVTDLVQEAPRTLREQFSTEAGERLGRPEALRRAADQEKAAERAHFCARNASREASSSAFEGGGSESCGSRRSSSSRLRGAGPSADVVLALSDKPK